MRIFQKVDRVKPLMQGHINFSKFIESNKFGNVYRKMSHFCFIKSV